METEVLAGTVLAARANHCSAAAVYMNVALLHAPVQEVEASWDTSDILAALEEIETGQSRVSAVEVSYRACVALDTRC